ncbi:hypothetical protein ACHQM5_025062 [Ranunculus cassubicifolius]
MKNSRMTFALNTITMFIFFFLVLSYSMTVDASRPLSDTFIAPSWMEGFTIIAKAYSGPSKGGKGH